jgi:hypothetical protein
MLDAIYNPTGADPKIVASVSAVFDQVNRLGTEIVKAHKEKEHINFEIPS